MVVVLVCVLLYVETVTLHINWSHRQCVQEYLGVWWRFDTLRQRYLQSLKLSGACTLESIQGCDFCWATRNIYTYDLCGLLLISLLNGVLSTFKYWGCPALLGENIASSFAHGHQMSP